MEVSEKKANRMARSRTTSKVVIQQPPQVLTFVGPAAGSKPGATGGYKLVKGVLPDVA